MKRIVVISDTHFSISAQKLPAAVIEEIILSDMVLHAGDITSHSLLDYLEYELQKETFAVMGNCDMARDAKRTPLKRIVRVEKLRIGLIHGYGGYYDMEQRISGEFPPDVKCVVFGHTHHPCNRIIDGRLYFNPGTPTARRHSTGQHFGILNVDGESVTGEIRPLSQSPG